MTKQNKNGKSKATLEEMVKSDSQIVLQREDGTEQAIEEIIDNQASTQDNPYANEFHYKSWWNQFRGPWLQSEKMTEEQIKIKADDAWGITIVDNRRFRLHIFHLSHDKQPIIATFFIVLNERNHVSVENCKKNKIIGVHPIPANTQIPRRWARLCGLMKKLSHSLTHKSSIPASQFAHFRHLYIRNKF